MRVHDLLKTLLIIMLTVAAPVQAQLAQRGALTPSDAAGGFNGAYTYTALSADGALIAVGSPSDAYATGAVFIFRRGPDGTWTEQQKLQPVAPGPGIAAFVGPVAMSGDGRHLIIGGWGEGPDQTGAVWFYAADSAGVFHPVSGKQVSPDVGAHGFQGLQVAMSDDGQTALVGAPNDDNSRGAVLVYARQGEVWTQQAKLKPATLPTNANFGNGLAVSADGNTVLIGATGEGRNENRITGAAYAFARTGATWRQLARLSPAITIPANGAGRIGSALALSADGRTALIGAPGDGDTGAVYVYDRTGDLWAWHGGRLISGFIPTPAQQGGSVALSQDGNTALIGGTSASGAWLFRRTLGTWQAYGQRVVPSGAPANNNVVSVGLSRDASVAVTAYTGSAASGHGSAWVYTQTGYTGLLVNPRRPTDGDQPRPYILRNLEPPMDVILSGCGSYGPDQLVPYTNQFVTLTGNGPTNNFCVVSVFAH